MGRLDRAEPYNWVELSHAVPIRLIGPLGHQYDHLSLAFSHILMTTRTRSVAINHISAVTWLLNQVVRICPDPAAMIEAGFDECRKVQDRFLVAVNAGKRRASGEPSAFWIEPPTHIFARVQRAIASLCVVTETLAPIIYEGRDPSRSDGWLAQPGRTIQRRVSRKRFTADTGRRFRFPKNPEIGPRTNDPRMYERWNDSALTLGLAEESRRISFMSRRTGARFCSIRAINLADFFKRGVPSDCLPAINKGSGGRRTLLLVIGDDTRADLEALVARRHPDVWARRGRFGEVEQAQLRRIPLISFDGVSPVPYWKFCDDFKLAADHADLSFVEFKDGREVRKLITPQQLRHEFVFEQLEKIELLPAEERPAAREALASYIGWRSGEEMLSWYSNFFETRQALGLVRKLSDLDVMMDEPEGSADDLWLESSLL